jgi:hypothetical protein
MKVGAEPKKLAILGGLLLAAGYLIYTNVFSGRPAGSAGSTAPRVQTLARAPQIPEAGGPVPRAEARPATRSTLQEFRPTLKPGRGGGEADLSSIDPTLRLDLLAKLEEVRVQGGNRSLFEFSAAPLPATPEAKVVPKPKIQTVPVPPAPAKPSEAEAKPPAPPIPLKFYGYVTAFGQGNRRAFFLDGDQIVVASEGEVLKKRYRVVRIGVNSVVVEDLDFKAEQTLPLEPQVG